ncbi:metal tolerance protein C4 isoform X2 [Gossypium australe]|uniref:Metal tolerance protein C4 isoform X2 n=1 Tax=Gossypium australe TaxID=47621 RepID=A0A5B6W846_9ROSI|nr:metal tolerance protein C4 isoform X2 [Gossypium australe]
MQVAIFLIQRNRHALIGRAIDEHDMQKVLHFLKNDPVVDALYDCKSEVIGPGFFRFKAEIDFNGVVVVQNYLNRTGREEWARQVNISVFLFFCFNVLSTPLHFCLVHALFVIKNQHPTLSIFGLVLKTMFRESAKEKDDSALLKIMSNYGEEVVTALGSEVDRLEKEIQELVPGIRHVDIEAHNPIDLPS